MFCLILIKQSSSLSSYNIYILYYLWRQLWLFSCDAAIAKNTSSAGVWTNPLWEFGKCWVTTITVACSCFNPNPANQITVTAVAVTRSELDQPESWAKEGSWKINPVQQAGINTICVLTTYDVIQQPNKNLLKNYSVVLREDQQGLLT